MPCQSDYLRRHSDEEESVRVLSLLAEVGLDTSQGGPIDSYYGRANTLDADTDRLCTWMKTYTDEQVKSMSLELQIWWRNHQIADRQRQAREAEAAAVAKVRSAALSKLTDTEQLALGIKPHP